jgi:uncharacterized protein (DUF1778 family)
MQDLDDKRSCSINLRMLPNEYNLIRERAAAASLSLAAYCRHAAIVAARTERSK